MQQDAILPEVKRTAQLESRTEADSAVKATLNTLGERIPVDQAEKLAGELPEEYAGALTERSEAEPEEFPLEEFVRRVAERERYESSDASPVERHSRAVLTTLADAGLGSELSTVRDQLPDEYDALFEEGGSSRSEG